MDNTKDKVGYEINFNRYFFKNNAARPLDVINKELSDLWIDIQTIINE